MSPHQRATFLFLSALLLQKWSCWAWTVPAPPLTIQAITARSPRTALYSSNFQEDDVTTDATIASRRSWLLKSASTATAILGACTSITMNPIEAIAADATTTTSTAQAQVTDRIFLEIKGLGPEPKRIVIGLFGKEAPRSTKMLKQLVTTTPQGGGLPAPCKPKAERTLQKEQLEANKVYNSCIDTQEKGVNYEYSQIWRIVPNERIDVGAVSGKFIAREYPTWKEDTNSGLKHDSPGIVSVRKGNDSGFGFTIYPGNNPAAAALLDEEHIVVGKVENLEIVQELNEVPVITSSKKLNYMALTGGPTTKSAPTRACQYGGPMYCNENKPLIKLSTMNSGVL